MKRSKKGTSTLLRSNVSGPNKILALVSPWTDQKTFGKSRYKWHWLFIKIRQSFEHSKTEVSIDQFLLWMAGLNLWPSEVFWWVSPYGWLWCWSIYTDSPPFCKNQICSHYLKTVSWSFNDQRVYNKRIFLHTCNFQVKELEVFFFSWFAIVLALLI